MCTDSYGKGGHGVVLLRGAEVGVRRIDGLGVRRVFSWPSGARRMLEMLGGHRDWKAADPEHFTI